MDWSGELRIESWIDCEPQRGFIASGVSCRGKPRNSSRDWGIMEKWLWRLLEAVLGKTQPVMRRPVTKRSPASPMVAGRVNAQAARILNTV